MLLALLRCGLFLAVLQMSCAGSDENALSMHEVKNEATGDPRAILLARKVVEKSGGKENFDRVPGLSFDYFGRRYWYWDKKNNRYRFESDSKQLRVAGKLDGSETHVWLRGEMANDPDTLSKYRDFAYKAWTNDTYWLLFPLKLMDPGVQLKFLGECEADSLTKATCIELTFDQVGITPDNKYIAYIDTIKNEVIRWDYFKSKSDDLPSLSNPWTDYSVYGNLRLSSGRGDGSLEEIQIHDDLKASLFLDVSKTHRQILHNQQSH